MTRNEIVEPRGRFTDIRSSLLDPRGAASGSSAVASGAAAHLERDLREFCCRMLGWADDQASRIDEMVSRLLAAVDLRQPIALRGAGDLVPIAHALHRRLFGSECPFIVCNPRRHEGDGSVRSPPSRRTGMLALDAATGGSVCIRSNRLPKDIDQLSASLRDCAGTVQLFVCLHRNDQVIDILYPPIEIPSLAQRPADLDRLIDTCLVDAAQTLGVRTMPLSRRARDSILWQARSLADVEKAVTRLVVLRSTKNLSEAARQLGMAPISLNRWLHRRRMVDG
jgi:hypothetical protein